jgi:hypothetical protein
VTVKKPTSDGSKPGEGGDSGLQDVKTKGVIIETDDAYNVSNGVISIRNGGLAIIGKGTEFLKGSSLKGIGTIVDGTLKIIGTDKNGGIVYASGSAEEKCTAEIRTEDTFTYNRFNEYGLEQSATRNDTTGALVTTTVNRDKDGNVISTDTVLVAISRKGEKQQDTGVGYYVYNFGSDGKVELKISVGADGKVISTSLGANDEVGRIIARNSATNMIVYDYKADSNGKVQELGYQYRNGSNATQLYTFGDKYYGLGKDGKSAFRIDFKKAEDGSGIGGFDVTNVAGTKKGNAFVFTQPEMVSDQFTKYAITGIALSYKNSKGETVSPQLMTNITQVYNYTVQQWYDVTDSFSVGEDQMAMIKVFDEKGDFLWNGYCLLEKGKGWRSIRDGDSFGGMTIRQVQENRWFLYTNDNKDINFSAADGAIKATWKCLEITQTKDAKFALVTNETIDATYTAGGKTTNVKLNSGAVVNLQRDKDGGYVASIISGDITFPGTIYVEAKGGGKAGTGGAASPLPSVNTYGKIITKFDKAGNVTGYEITNGRVSIREGELVVIGKGTVFLEGSVLGDHFKVTSGSIRVDVDANGNIKYVANDKYAKTTYGNQWKTYNAKGVSGSGV